MKILSYNINGFKSFVKTDENNNSKLSDLINKFSNYDLYCFQETKLNSDSDIMDSLSIMDSDYDYYIANNTDKKGYSGVMTVYNKNTINIIGHSNKIFKYNNDSTYTAGRILTTELDNCYILNVYSPNSANKTKLRHDWNIKLTNYIKTLDKPIIICGDMNVCSTVLDYWGDYEKSINTMAGLMQFEIDDFNNMINECSLVDVYRYYHKNTRKYSWYSTRNKNSVKNNYGWRLDYFLVSKDIIDKVKSCDVCQGFQSPDHSPIIMDISI